MTKRPAAKGTAARATAGKRKAARKPASLPAHKLFEVASLSRAEIAGLLNDAIGAQRSRVRRFKPTDPRLTDEVCERFAFAVSDGLLELAEEAAEEARADAASDALEEFEDALDEG